MCGIRKVQCIDGEKEELKKMMTIKQMKLKVYRRCDVFVLNEDKRNSKS